MTNGAITTCVVAMNALCTVTTTLAQAATGAAAAENPFMMLVQNGGVSAVLAIFCWHFMRRNKELEKKLEDERARLENELKEERAKCKTCAFVEHANEEFLKGHKEHDD